MTPLLANYWEFRWTCNTTANEMALRQLGTDHDFAPSRFKTMKRLGLPFTNTQRSRYVNTNAT